MSPPVETNSGTASGGTPTKVNLDAHTEAVDLGLSSSKWI
jgi:hypothetical protein